MTYQPKTGEQCSCRPGIQRDNCSECEGTGMRIDFKAIRACYQARCEQEAMHEEQLDDATRRDVGNY